MVSFFSKARHVKSFSSFVDGDSVVITILFDKNVTVPDTLSARQLKQRERAIIANPFTAADLRKKEKECKAKDLQVWQPFVDSFAELHSGSEAGLSASLKNSKVTTLINYHLSGISSIGGCDGGTTLYPGCGR